MGRLEDLKKGARVRGVTPTGPVTVIDAVRAAAEALRRERFAHRAARELAELRENTAAWEDYVTEAESSALSDRGA